jgi:hypothetical protein
VTRTVLVAVEVSCDAEALSSLETVAVQWAQEIRYRAVGAGVSTANAVQVTLPGSLYSLADALRAAHEGLTR